MGMKIHREKIDVSIFVLGFILVGLIFAVTMKSLPSFAIDDEEQAEQLIKTDESFVTIFDSNTNVSTTIRTSAANVGEVLERFKIEIEEGDIVEPAVDELISSGDFRINIYRAKPAVVIDGARQMKIMTAATDPVKIVENAGIELLEADVVDIVPSINFIESGLPIAYNVVRAKEIQFNYYGQILTIRTGAETIEDFLAERKVTVTEMDWISHALNTEITNGLELELFRQGKNTITIEEEIEFAEQITYDYGQNIGYREITSAGELGTKSVTYEIEMKDGQEISKIYISEIVTREPTTQTITIGMRAINMKPLTKAMGRNRYTTSTGILREETYYDLDMSVVMRNCGGGGYYTVREDLVKIDKDGYVIVAADLSRYPRCSIVETSLGLGKVYDTGSFALHNPEQFDIATDWTRPGDGR